MAGVLMHGGWRLGHQSWCQKAITAGVADGVVISPFSTPRVKVPRYSSGCELAFAVSAAGGEVIFDPTTHARLLPDSDRLDHYDTWELWGASGVGLDTQSRRYEHVERVFERQRELSAPAMAPGLVLHSTRSPEASDYLTTARVAKSLDRSCWQSLAASRSFWRSGRFLDDFVGRLAQLRSPTWVVTVINDPLNDSIPDLSDTTAFVGLCRTIHSLSERSRVIVMHSDFGGLLGVAAGADSVGSGWDRSMRFFDQDSYKVNTPGIRIPASMVTQGGLAAVLRRDAAEAIERWNRQLAPVIRGGAMPNDDAAERHHHLSVLRDVILRVAAASDRRSRVNALMSYYDRAGRYFDQLIQGLPRVVRQTDKDVWQSRPRNILYRYGSEESLIP